MKTLNALVVKPEECQKIEGLFNKFLIGMNDWDRSKKFEVKGREVVVYNVVCDEDTCKSIKNLIKESRRVES